MLFFSSVYDRNSIVKHGKGDGVLVQSGIRYVVGKAIDVVVLHEVSQKGDICAIPLHFGDAAVQIGDAAVVRSKRIDEQIPYGKVEEATDVVLVIADTIYRVVVDFTDNIYVGGCFEGRKKLFVLLKTSVKPNAVNTIERSDIGDPRYPFVHNSGIFGRQIGKLEVLITKPTLRRLGGVLVIGEGTVRVVVTFIIENVVYGVVNSGGAAVPSHVVRNRVDHKILSYISARQSFLTTDRSTYHASLVQGIRQGLQVRRSPKVRVELVDLLWPESMVSRPIIRNTRYLLRDRRYPDSGESHVLYVVQVVDYSLPRATTVICEITAGRRASIGLSKAVGKKLVDRLRPPLVL